MHVTGEPDGPPTSARCRTSAPVRVGEGVRVRTVAPKLGQHNAEIFSRLGLSEAEIKDLCGKRVL